MIKVAILVTAVKLYDVIMVPDGRCTVARNPAASSVAVPLSRLDLSTRRRNLLS